ncbi:sulfite exporter TauE/SafE family protein [Hyphobacterium sp.]|uniref:sulfite exporter TauE/SafE family protein n=1 Tax=Hyphobacterium sp. TaxID=2004662 RepID=UPI003B5176AC
MTPDLIGLAAALVATGLFAGLIAGLFGIGGGVVMVPAFYFVLGALGYDDAIRMHMAVGTSLAVIVATSLRSVAAHTRHGAVDFAILRTWTPWIVVGALIGGFVADLIPGRGLTGLFGAVALLLSLQFFFGRPDWRLAEEMPGGIARAGLGSLIGLLSALLGIGGGVFGVTLMTLSGKPIRHAVATAAGFGVAIGLPGALGFIIWGWDEPGRTPTALGYVDLLGFFILATSAFFVAPLGAKLAHTMPERLLRRLFALGLVLTAFSLLREALVV